MARPKTIYSLRGVFTSLLEDTEKNKFMIPTYQRGYKWTSSGDNNHVEVLMRDLHLAFERGSNNRYYLQFITLKKNGTELEVIDGQQRLVTLTIVFCVLAYFEEIKQEKNFVSDKLNYQVRENFVKTFIYKDISWILKSNNWDGFLANHKNVELDIDNQDVYFIYHATKAIYEFVANKLDGSKRKGFYDYLCEQVFLIINLLDNDMNSEKIFINVNKGVKLNDEDLVKGLLITKIPLDNQTQQYRMTENEINEVRANIGRQWDDLASWASREDIKKFFKTNPGDGNRLGWLIRLTYPDVLSSEALNPMFSYLDDLYRTKKQQATDIFNTIRKTMLTLNDWFDEPELCNLLGYVLHVNDSPGINSVWRELSNYSTKTEILRKLKALCIGLLPLDEVKGELKELNYEDHKSELFNLFLMLDIAKFLPIGKPEAAPYDYGKIASDNWSIEHIFPQNAKDFKNLNSLAKEDLTIIQELLSPDFGEVSVEEDDKKEAILTMFNKIKQAENECQIGIEERETLEYLLGKKAGDLHKLGNLALLQHGMNSRLSNHFFDGKRKILVQKVSEGKFVPYHTYDVFSKLVIETGTGLHVWSKADIEQHEEYIRSQIKHVLNYLSPKS